jgi:hypothetical protein
VTAVLGALGWMLTALLVLALSRLTPDLRDVGQPDQGGDDEW